MGSLTRTYRVKLYPSRRAHEALDAQFAAQARLYNAALEHRRGAYRRARETVNFAMQCKELTGVREDDPDFASVHRTIQVATLRRLDRAYQAFFRRLKNGENPGFPRFKSARRWRTLVCDNNVQSRQMVKVGDRGKGWIRIKGLPSMEFKSHRQLPAIENLMELRVVRTAHRVEAQLVFTTEADLPPCPLIPSAPVGIDLGVKSVVALSDGEVIEGLKDDRRRTRRLQRKVSRANKGSLSRHKKVHALSRERERQTARRKGWLHELSAGLVSRYDFIAMEDLAIQNMTRSAKGTVEEPGRNVRAKAGLNRSILEQGWGDLVNKIQYKAESAGVGFIQVAPQNTSQECSGCRTLVPKSLSERIHRCPSCGLTLNRDVNAARNVLRRGLMARVNGGKQAVAPAARLSTEAIGPGRRRKPTA